jgi:hypothetical protein
LHKKPPRKGGKSEGGELSWEDFVAMMDADQPAKKRGPYKKTEAENSN